MIPPILPANELNPRAVPLTTVGYISAVYTYAIANAPEDPIFPIKMKVKSLFHVSWLFSHILRHFKSQHFLLSNLPTNTSADFVDVEVNPAGRQQMPHKNRLNIIRGFLPTWSMVKIQKIIIGISTRPFRMKFK